MKASPPPVTKSLLLWTGLTLIACGNIKVENIGKRVFVCHVKCCSAAVMHVNHRDVNIIFWFMLGTGCNAAYVEKVDNVDKWTGPKHESPMVRNAILRHVFAS